MDFLSYIWSIVWDWLGLLAGALGAIMALYERAKKQEIHPRRYVAILVGFLLLAGFSAWRVQRDATQKALKDLETKQEELKAASRPQLKGVIQYVSAGIPSSEVPDTTTADTVVTIVASIYNSGSDSVADRWSCWITLPNRNTKVLGAAIMVPDELELYGESKTAFAIFHGEKDSLAIKTVEEPIVRGGKKTGVLIYLFKNVPKNDIVQAGNQLVVSFKDVVGQPYSIVYDLGGPTFKDAPYIPGLERPRQRN